MKSKEVREKFIQFFKKKEHKIVSSSSLIPEDDTVLLTTAGMQQFVPYLTGEKSVLSEFKTRHLASVQKCFRTLDIEEIGDDTHYTFFEMLGNWSIGEDEEKGYFKKGAIELAIDFFVNEMGLSKERIYVTVFKGEKGIPRDDEAISIWTDKGFPKERIAEFGTEDNFWGPTSETGPCGPCSEIHYDRGQEYGCLEDCGPNCENCNRFVELWNLVFMEYNMEKDGSYTKLPQKNIDTGIGFERLVSLLQGKDSAYETDLFSSAIKKIEELSGKRYEENKKEFRVIADHARGSIFLIADSVLPSNKGAGYVLRRIIRRMIRYKKEMGIESLNEIVDIFIKEYSEFYHELENKNILKVIQEEEEKFEKTLEDGLKELKRIQEKGAMKNDKIDAGDAFYVYQTFGFPLEMIQEELEKSGLSVDEEKFKEAFYKHQEISRKGAEEKFGGLSKDVGEDEAKLHTATHLLHQALREVLGDHVIQRGSDINRERLRFDFSHSQSLSKEEIMEIERIVNEKIKEDLEVKEEKMSLEKAREKGVIALFQDDKMGDISVYYIGNFSAEACGGPHIKKTSELGKFTIKKEESSGAGVRRIKAVLN